MFSVYILFSEKSDRYYIGQTNDLAARSLRHNNGSEKSTAPHKPWKISCSINKPTRSEAMILEKKLKNLNTEDLVKFITKYGHPECGSRGEARDGEFTSPFESHYLPKQKIIPRESGVFVF